MVILVEEVINVVIDIGYLVFVCLFYVFGGWVMEIVELEEVLKYYMMNVVKVNLKYLVLVDCYVSG